MNWGALASFSTDSDSQSHSGRANHSTTKPGLGTQSSFTLARCLVPSLPCCKIGQPCVQPYNSNSDRRQDYLLVFSLKVSHSGSPPFSTLTTSPLHLSIRLISPSMPIYLDSLLLLPPPLPPSHVEVLFFRVGRTSTTNSTVALSPSQ